jgi:hypothetical protein
MGWLILVLGLVGALVFRNRMVFVALFLAVFTSIAVQRVVSDINVEVGVDFQGTEVVRTTESCGSPTELLLDRNGAKSALPSGLRRLCTLSTNTRLVESIVTLIVGAGGAIVAWTLFPRLSPIPIDEVLNPLPRAGESSIRKDDEDADQNGVSASS